MRKAGTFFADSLRLAGASVSLVWLALAGGAAQAQGESNGDTVGALVGLIETHCLECHNFIDWAGGLALDVMDITRVAEDAEIWEHVVHKMRGRLMPPAGAAQPTQDGVDALVAYLETALDEAAGERPRVGYVPIHRLSRTELEATLKALIGVDIDARSTLPTEVEVHGFTNIAEVLSMSPSFMEQYLAVVRRAVRLAAGEPVPRLARVTIRVGPAAAGDFPLGTRGGTPRGGIRFTHVFPADGEYRFIVPEEDFIDAGLYPRGMQTEATLVILIDGVEVVRKQIGGPEFLDIADRDGPAGKQVLLDMIASSAFVRAGRREVVMTFIERSRALSNSATGGGFGGGAVSDVPILQTAIEIEGPHAPQGLSANDSRDRIFVCAPVGPAEERPCAQQIARHMATLAFRRPVTDAEIERLMPFYEMGRAEPGGFDAGVTELVTAILSSPDFLYRTIPASPDPNESRLLTDLELATRLSYFLWSTGPDGELLELGAEGRLSDPAVMNAQVDRLLEHPRADALVENFALAWLNLDGLDRVEPVDPAFSAAMRINFETEIRRFVASVLLEDRSVTDLIDADWTFVNESLARHYGISGVYGGQFRRVTLEDENRFGLLGKGAVLLHTSYADRTSPVLRGTWILERIMGTPPAPPPPGVETDLSIVEEGQVTTIRERLEEHRDNPSCQGCHGVIDPPGLALENFDSIGRWRDFDEDAQAFINAGTTLSSGITVNGPVELRRYLTSRPDQFPTTVTTRLMTYALNREVEYFDVPRIRQILRDAAESDYTLRAIVKGIVASDAFRRQGPDERQRSAASGETGGAPQASHR
jgi:mono/diheme cytochrome c family protein